MLSQNRVIIGVMLKLLVKELQSKRDTKRAELLGHYFKTGRNQYGEGDIFLGITLPVLRGIAKKYNGLTAGQLEELLASKFHEYRLTALFILLARYRKADSPGRKAIAGFYLANRKGINNWDLIDSSAPGILGDYLLNTDRRILYRLVRSTSLWDRRIAVLAAFTFIREHQYDDAVKIAGLLLKDPHDLIHKAVGWMLREVGKKNLALLEDFLEMYAAVMPRTMLRYAIEKMPDNKRRYYLKITPVKKTRHIQRSEI